MEEKYKIMITCKHRFEILAKAIRVHLLVGEFRGQWCRLVDIFGAFCGVGRMSTFRPGTYIQDRQF